MLLTISTFFLISICPLEAQNITVNQKGISTDEALDPDFKQLYLVFAGPYPASPSSAFGHLFLLVEPEKSNSSNPQLWKAINFAANVEGHSGVSTLYNGLLGKLEGSFEESPFYKKIRSYSYAESRDLWLFPIQLTSSEKKRFSDYINNNRKRLLQYRFSDKNCATRVNEVLHYALDIPYSSHFFVLPQDVLNNDIIKERFSQPLWIENFEGQLTNVISRYGDEFSKLDIDSLNATHKVHLLKTFEWLYNNHSTTLDAEKEEFIHQLRYEVAQQKTDYRFQSLEQKQFKIHYPARVSINYLYAKNSLNNLLLDVRLGLHNFSDNAYTYPKYDYIDVFRLSARFSQTRISLDKFWIFHQSSRQPQNEINSPVSWSIGLGGDRFMYDNQSTMALGLYSGLGKTFYFIDEIWTTSLMLFLNPTYFDKQTWSIIANPKIENRFFISQKVKGLLEVSNPLFLQSKELLNPKLKVKGIYSLTDNLYLNNTLELRSDKLKFLLGFNYNFPI